MSAKRRGKSIADEAGSQLAAAIEHFGDFLGRLTDARDDEWISGTLGDSFPDGTSLTVGDLRTALGYMKLEQTCAEKEKKPNGAAAEAGAAR